MRREASCDVLVAGHGAAGCVAGARLASFGLKVTVLGCGTSATALSTGRIFFPGEVEAVQAPMGFLREHGAPWGLFQGPVRLREARTNLGTISAQTLSSGHEWTVGDDEVAALGLVGNSDLEPDLLRASASRSPRPAEVVPYWTDPRPWPRDRGGIIDALSTVLSDLSQENVVVPPLFPEQDWHTALDQIERRSGRKVCEATTPLSFPGQRLQSCLEEAAVRCGCTLLKDRQLVDVDLNGREAVSATVMSGIREVRMEFRVLILACGNLIAGGLATDGSMVREPLLALSIKESRAKRPRSLPLRNALSAGVETRGGKAVTTEGRRTSNIFVAGSMISGMSYPLGKGLGPVMSSAWKTAELAREAL